MDYYCDSTIVTPIHKLPDEVLEHIFSFLSIKERIQIEVVCKRWRMNGKSVPWRWPRHVTIVDQQLYRLCLRYQMLQDIILPHSAFILTSRVPLVMPRCGVGVKYLKLVNAGTSTSSDGGFNLEIVKVISAFCSNITEFVGSGVTNIVLDNLTDCCEKLTSVKLNPHINCDDSNLAAFIARCKALEILRIRGNYQIHGYFFAFVNPKLKVLLLDDCAGIDEFAMEILISRCNYLQELRITYCMLAAKTMLGISSKYHKSLKRLNLDGTSTTESVDWCEIISNLENLEEFSANKPSCDIFITGDVLKALATKCKKLRVLSIGRHEIDDEAIMQLTVAPQLKVLNISENSKITGVGLEILATQGRLEEVIAINSCMNIPDKTFSSLAKWCPNFHTLDVSGVYHVTDELVTSFNGSISNGFLTQNVKLIVGGTSVHRNVEKCEKLQVVFDTTKFDLVGRQTD